MRSARTLLQIAAALLLLGQAACDGLADSPDGCAGKCDDTSSAPAAICGPREAARGDFGCTSSSTTDFGLDPEAAPIVSATIFVGLHDPETPLRVAIYDGEKRIRTIGVPAGKNRVVSIKWDGMSETGELASAAVHRLSLETSSVGSADHRMYTLVSLLDEGEGHEHPLGSDSKNSDDWGRVHVVSALMQVADAWQHPHKIAYLDLSSQNGGEFRPHTYHRHGDCVDIRYPRTDGPGPLNLANGTRFYDKAAAQDLVDALHEAGASEVFIDARAGLVGDFLVEVGGHHDHLHAAFAKDPDALGAARATNEGFVGGPCLDDSDCPLRDGFCLRDDPSAPGICTRECKGRCADFIGGIYTLSECVVTERALCMPARDIARYPETDGCRADLERVALRSEDRQNALTEVCVPKD